MSDSSGSRLPSEMAYLRIDVVGQPDLRNSCRRRESRRRNTTRRRNKVRHEALSRGKEEDGRHRRCLAFLGASECASDLVRREGEAADAVGARAD